jgi:hypothetical protein
MENNKSEKQLLTNLSKKYHHKQKLHNKKRKNKIIFIILIKNKFKLKNNNKYFQFYKSRQNMKIKAIIIKMNRKWQFKLRMLN